MPNFSPSGTIHIGNVPFNSNYTDTVISWGSASEQATAMLGRMDSTISNSTYTYVRMNNSIRVQGNAESLYNYNYVMYQNSNYGSKWFYAFIVAVNYLNENCTEFVLQLDVLQTWWFDLNLRECFVEREHVTDDTIGAHLNPEPAMSLDYETYQNADYYNQGRFVVLMVNAYPHYNQSYTAATGSDPYSGGVYHNQYNACKMLVYDTLDSTSMEKLKTDLDSYNGVGAAETICDAFMCSTYTLPVDGDGGYLQMESFNDWIGRVNGVWQVKENQQAPKHEIIINRCEEFQGYVPRNNKLFVYPYCYATLGDFSGRESDYRFEFEDNSVYRSNGQIHFYHQEPISSDLVAYVWPADYNGQAHDRPISPFTADMSNKISWVFSTYQNWAAQNAAANQLAVVGSVASIGFSVLPGAGAAVKTLAGAQNGLNDAFMNVLHGTSASANLQMQKANMAYANRFSAAKEAFAEGMSAQGVAAGALGLGGTFATIDRMSKVPNTAKGNTAGNAKYQMNKAGFYTRSIRLLPEYAKIVDGFFTMYGYQVDSLKVPNTMTRPNWNYVKTQASKHTGNIPSSHLAAINAIFNTGFTIWHTWDVGNYELDNSPI